MSIFRGSDEMRSKLFKAFLVIYGLTVGFFMGMNDLVAKTILRMGTLAPSGSSWMNVADELEKAVEQKSNGEIDIIWYSGGIMGDEADMVRKMRLKQLQGAAFTGVGLGKILPEERILELPLVIGNTEEIDKVLNELTPYFASKFEAKGFKLMGWAEQGFVYLFTKKHIRTFDDLRGVKIWVWAGDDFAMEIFKSIGIITPVPIAVPEVLTALQTKLIDAFYNTPLGTVALQWQPYVSHMTNYPICYGSAALVLSKGSFDRLKLEYQDLLAKEFEKYARKIAVVARKDNEEILSAFSGRGITLTSLDDEIKKDLQKRFDSMYVNLAGKQYPLSLLKQMLSVLGKPLPGSQ